MIAYILRHWRGEFSLAASLLINLPLGIAVSFVIYFAGGKLLLGNVPRDVFGAWFWGGASWWGCARCGA